MLETKNIYRGIIVALLIVVIFFVWREVEHRQKYYAVYMASGDMYFGTIQSFPSLVVKHAYVLQQDGQGGYFLSPFTSALWGPSGDIKLNRDNVLWMAEIDKTSRTAQLLAGTIVPDASAGALDQQIGGDVPLGMLPGASSSTPTSTDGTVQQEGTSAGE